MSHYTWHNVTESSRVTTKHAFATFSFIFETFIFLYVGMDALDIEKWRFVNDSPGTSVAVSSVLLALVMAGRAAFVFPLSFISNLAKKSASEKISLREQIVIWWAGLMRGAVSMALAYNQFTRAGHTQLRSNAIMITSTISIVLFSTVVFGMLTKPLIRFLLPHPKATTSMLSDPSTPISITVPFLGSGQDSFEDAKGLLICHTWWQASGQACLQQEVVTPWRICARQTQQIRNAEESNDTEESKGMDIYIRVPSLQSGLAYNLNDKKRKKIIIVISIVPGLIILTMLLCFLKKQWKKVDLSDAEMGSGKQSKGSSKLKSNAVGD